MKKINELDNIKGIDKNLNNIFIILFNKLDNILDDIEYYNDNGIIKFILILCMNSIFLLNKVLIKINTIITYNEENNKKMLIKIQNIERILTTKNIEIMEIYNKLFNNTDKNITDKNITIEILKKINYNTNIKVNNLKGNNLKDNNLLDTNLNLYSLDNINKLISNNDSSNNDSTNNDLLLNYKNDSNYIGYEKINIGFNNFYYLHTFYSITSNLPFNLLLYIKEIDQVIIKIGYKNKFQYINSKLYKTSSCSEKSLFSNENKYHSILCNNNIKQLNKKCFNKQCTYYHDYFLGYNDNYHKIRTFTVNPIVYNCISFKDGSKVSENVKKIPWYNAINLYQSSLSNLLISCIHSQE